MADQTDQDFTRRSYAISHTTSYRYECDDVTACYERGILRLRETRCQQVLSTQVVVTPQPDVVSTHQDVFGNHSHYLEVRTPHRELIVAKSSVVSVCWPKVDMQALDRWTVESAARWWSQVDCHGVGELDATMLAGYLLPSSLVSFGPGVAHYAAQQLTLSRPLGQAILGLTQSIHRDFRYAKGVTSTSTSLPEVLGMRAGVCQDFAHLAVGCLRMMGLPTRYVSGYIETRPAPGKVKLAGSDASHAWASVAVPGAEGGVDWVDLDPTNNHLADSRYIVSAWGRDFRDVSPLRGVVFTEASSSKLTVAVDVTRLDD